MENEIGVVGAQHLSRLLQENSVWFIDILKIRTFLFSKDTFTTWPAIE